MELVAIGDLHLTDSSGRGGLYKYVKNCDQQVMKEVVKVCEWALERGITNLVFEGDVCENPRMSYEAHHALLTFLQSKLARKFQIYIYLGNHDKVAHDSEAGHSLELLQFMNLPHVHLYTEDTEVVIDGAPVKFCPWPSQEFNKKALNFAHTEVRGAKSDGGRTFDGEDLSESDAIIIVGHLHTSHSVRNTHYTGTLYQTNFGEPPEKYFHHIVFNSVKDYEVELIPFKPKYRLHTCIIGSQSDVDNLPKGKHDLVKVVIEEGADIDDTTFADNVVVVRSFKTKQELKAILSEDLLQGEALVVKTSKMFSQWLKAQKLKPKEEKRLSKLRKRILKGSK